MLNIIIKGTLIPDILSSNSTAELPYIPGSSLRGALRLTLMTLTDKLKPLHFKTQTEFIDSMSTGSGKSCLLDIIERWLLVSCPGQNWKHQFRNEEASFTNQGNKNRTVVEVLKKEVMSYTSTGSVQPGLTWKLSSINFECEPNLPTFLQRYGRYGRTDSLRSNSDIDNILFSYSPVQCLLPTLERTSKEFGILSIQEIDKGKDTKGVGLQNCNSSSSKLLNPRQGIETSYEYLYLQRLHSSRRNRSRREYSLWSCA